MTLISTHAGFSNSSKRIKNRGGKVTTHINDASTKLVNIRVIIKRPYVKVNKDNATVLQFLDLLKEVVDISEVEELNSKLLEYMKKKQIKFDDMKPYLLYYPERIYKKYVRGGTVKWRICMKR